MGEKTIINLVSKESGELFTTLELSEKEISLLLELALTTLLEDFIEKQKMEHG